MKNSYKYFENRECEYFPCHDECKELNCLFCYCPLYGKDICPGTPVYIESNGKKIKDCSSCTYPHQAENYENIIGLI